MPLYNLRVHFRLSAMPKFRRLLLPLALLLATPLTHAADWKSVKTYAEFKLLAQAPSRKMDPAIARIWTLRHYYRAQYTADGLAYRSQKTLLEFDCQSDEFHVLMVTLAPGYYGMGAPARNIQIATPWQLVTPDSPEAAVQEVACKR